MSLSPGREKRGLLSGLRLSSLPENSHRKEVRIQATWCESVAFLQGNARARAHPPFCFAELIEPALTKQELNIRDPPKSRRQAVNFMGRSWGQPPFSQAYHGMSTRPVSLPLGGPAPHH